MKKFKKLLSVLLAIVMLMSCFTVLGSAAQTNYKTVADLTALDAYSPYGQVTRLTAEERMSIVGDALDNLLAQLNINMGTVVNISWLGLTVTLNLTSIDNVCASLDSIQSTLNGVVATLGSAILNLGVLEDLNMDSWTSGMSRSGTAQLTIAQNFFNLLGDNGGLVETVLTEGLDLGILGSFISGLNLDSINEIITDIPTLLKGMIFPMFERWDQTIEEVTKLENAMNSSSGDVLTTLDWIVNNYFTKPMSLTTVKATADGVMTSKHTLPSGDTNRRKFAVAADGSQIEVFQYYTASDVEAYNKTLAEGETARTANTYYSEGVYKLTQEVPGSTTYVYVLEESDDWGNTWTTTLKYYEDGSYWLSDMVADGVELHVTEETAADLLYKMIPYVFDAMAPVVINGSLKKLLAGLFGVQWTNLGLITDDAVLAKVQELPGYDSSMEVFGEMGDYLWEWSSFGYVENGEATNKDDYYFYRYEDQIFVGDASNANDMIEIINWDFTVTGDFMNEFIPGTSEASAAGNTYDHLLMSFNNFLVKAANLILDYDVLGISAPVWGTNDNLVSNIKSVAQAIIKHAPETIFGTPYEGTYYDLITSTGVAANKGDVEDDLVLTGIAALLIDALAPQAHMPTAESLANQEVKIGGLLAALVRELATQILPSIDYDALIYEDYNTDTFLSGKTNSYWLDVLMTIATDLGFKYLTAFADMWEDSSAWANLGYSLDKTYTLADFEANPTAWENKVDYIIDWALTVGADNGDPTWNVNNFVEEYLKDSNNNPLTVDMATNEDPWLKLDAILDNLLFLDQFTSETDLETGLRGTILDLVDLNWGNILGTPSNAGIIDIPEDSKLRTTNVVDAISLEVRDLINGLFKNIGGGSYELIPSSSISTIDDLVNQTNITAIAKALVSQLDEAYSNGLLHTILPFLNFFLGWKVDPQVYSEPIITTSYRDGDDYMFVWTGSDNYPAIEETKITFTNNSSGMLEKHRGTDVVDHAYEIKITGITSDATKNTLTFAYDETVSPYETIDVTVGGTYSEDETVAITIAYEYVGKDGQPIGGTQYKTIYAFISTIYSDANKSGRLSSDVEEGGSIVGANKTSAVDFKKFVFTENIKETVVNYMASVQHHGGVTGSGDDVSLSNGPLWKYNGYILKTASATVGCDDVEYKVAYGVEPNELGAKYFEGITSASEAGWDTLPGGGTISGYLYKLKSGMEDTLESDFETGVYDIGAITVAYNGEKAFYPEFIHYDDQDIGELANSYANMNITLNSIDKTNSAAVAAYDAYVTALKEAVRLATFPKMTVENNFAWNATTEDGTNWTLTEYAGIDGGAVTDSSVDYLSAIMPKIPAAIETLDAAYEALEAYLGGGTDSSAVGASTAELEAFLAEESEDEVNFQDYDFYEYFNFADLRTSARALVAGLYAPEVMDTYYIEGSGIREAELNNVIAAETNENIAAGITASRSENDPTAIYNSRVAHDDFVAPTYSDLYIDNQVSLLKFYKTLAVGGTINGTTVAGRAVAADMTFITREIAYADANYPMSAEDDYTEASWARYVEAYDAAVAAKASTTMQPSEVFAAKYELMVAMKNLLLKSNSANLNYEGYDRLLEAKANAEELLALTYAELELTDEAIAAGYTVDTALAEVVKALGYYYVGEDGNTWNLYADSVLEYVDNDRPNKSTNWRRMDAASANAENAVALFTNLAVTEPNTIMVKEDFVDTVIVDTEVKDIYLEWYPEYEEAYDAGSEVTGFIYGAEVFDVFLEDVLTTAYGDECLVITRTELAGDYDSTGTKIEVVDTEGNVLETYYYIYFGDLNCDGILDAEDVNLISTYNREGEPFESLCVFIASDYNGDTFTDGQDVTDVITANNSGEMVDQAAVAATFYEEYHAALE